MGPAGWLRLRVNDDLEIWFDRSRRGVVSGYTMADGYVPVVASVIGSLRRGDRQSRLWDLALLLSDRDARTALHRRCLVIEEMDVRADPAMGGWSANGPLDYVVNRPPLQEAAVVGVVAADAERHGDFRAASVSWTRCAELWRALAAVDAALSAVAEEAAARAGVCARGMTLSDTEPESAGDLFPYEILTRLGRWSFRRGSVDLFGALEIADFENDPSGPHWFGVLDAPGNRGAAELELAGGTVIWVDRAEPSRVCAVAVAVGSSPDATADILGLELATLLRSATGDRTAEFATHERPATPWLQEISRFVALGRDTEDLSYPYPIDPRGLERRYRELVLVLGERVRTGRELVYRGLIDSDDSVMLRLRRSLAAFIQETRDWPASELKPPVVELLTWLRDSGEDSGLLTMPSRLSLVTYGERYVGAGALGPANPDVEEPGRLTWADGKGHAALTAPSGSAVELTVAPAGFAGADVRVDGDVPRELMLYAMGSTGTVAATSPVWMLAGDGHRVASLSTRWQEAWLEPHPRQRSSADYALPETFEQLGSESLLTDALLLAGTQDGDVAAIAAAAQLAREIAEAPPDAAAPRLVVSMRQAALCGARLPASAYDPAWRHLRRLS